MKKLLPFGLSLAMLCTLAACSGNDTQVVEEFYEEEMVVEPVVEETAVLSIGCMESASAMDTLGFVVSGEAVSMLFDQGAGEKLSIEFWTADSTSVGSLSIADSGVVLYANDGMYEATWSLISGVVDITFEQCYFTLDDVGFVQVFLEQSDGSNEFLARLEVDEVERLTASTDTEDGVAVTYDTATYYTYDAYGQKVDDVMQITVDGEYIQISLLDRYETDFIWINDEEDSNTFWEGGSFSLNRIPVIDAQTGEEVYFSLRFETQYSYEIAPTELGQTSDLEADDLFYATYEIDTVDADGFINTLAAGTVYSDLSQSAGLAQNSSYYIASYTGLDGAPNLNVYDGGFEIEGVVSYSIPLYEYVITQVGNSFFNAIDNEGNEMSLYISQWGDSVEYGIYDSDFKKVVTWEGTTGDAQSDSVTVVADETEDSDALEDTYRIVGVYNNTESSEFPGLLTITLDEEGYKATYENEVFVLEVSEDSDSKFYGTNVDASSAHDIVELWFTGQNVTASKTIKGTFDLESR